jgi:uncharacterized iron-regulated protein
MKYIFFSAVMIVVSGASSAAIAQTPTSPPLQSGAPAPAGAATSAAAAYVPHRVYDTRRKRFIDFETMTAALARADVVYLGEQHNDGPTHRLQLAVLEGAARRREGPIVVSLEMFERDVQGSLNAYLAGSIDEAAFLAASRPWPNYAADYRPLVEFARARNWPVVAANIPRPFARAIARRGLGALDSLAPTEQRTWAAAELSCPRGDELHRRFAATMEGMGSHGGTVMSPDSTEAMIWRMYLAQCAKDETMGESVATAARAHRTLVIHANGAFHSDYRLGTADRARRRLPGTRHVVVSFVPVEDLDAADGKPLRKIGDFVVFTLRPPAPSTEATTRTP